MQHTDTKTATMGLIGACALGIGGMIGAGIFSILGVVGGIAGSAAWISFLGAGILAAFCGYNFARMGATYPTSGGPVEFLVRGLGNNRVSGSLNIMLWLGYVLALSLYASAFSGYAAALIQQDQSEQAFWLQPLISVAVVVLFLGLNVIGSAAVGKAESAIVAIKLTILIGFVGLTAQYIQPELLSMTNWSAPTALAFSLGTTFLAYEGFGLITNAAGSMKNPAKTLPRAIYISIAVTIVVYILVALATFGNLSADAIAEKAEYALAAAAKPALGQMGFTIMGVAALFSTASAINATLFGGANVSFQVAHDRQMPALFDHKTWLGAKWGLYITAVLVAVLAALVPLEAIANTGSAAFLMIYTGVGYAHLNVRSKTGGKTWLIWVSIVACLIVLCLLLTYLLKSDLASLIGVGALLIISIIIELIYHHYRGKIKMHAHSNG